nr:diadenosine 5',5'''-p1,p4-tetraphosphate phosphorylase 2 [Quercus suber]
MDESTSLAKFDTLVHLGLVRYDETQTTTVYVDEGLELMLLTCDGHRRQHEALDADDFSAAWAVLHDCPSHPMFFNCGWESGCSRMHKHMQLMPKPDQSFVSFLDDGEQEEPRIPFCWFWRRFDMRQGAPSPAALLRIYGELVRQATQVTQPHSAPPGSSMLEAVTPHNLILTTTWMVVIPRRREGVNAEAGANAMGMLGVIAVATPKEVQEWLARGLQKALGELGVCR